MACGALIRISRRGWASHRARVGHGQRGEAREEESNSQHQSILRLTCCTRHTNTLLTSNAFCWDCHDRPAVPPRRQRGVALPSRSRDCKGNLAAFAHFPRRLRTPQVIFTLSPLYNPRSSVGVYAGSTPAPSRPGAVARTGGRGPLPSRPQSDAPIWLRRHPAPAAVAPRACIGSAQSYTSPPIVSTAQVALPTSFGGQGSHPLPPPLHRRSSRVSGGSRTRIRSIREAATAPPDPPLRLRAPHIHRSRFTEAISSTGPVARARCRLPHPGRAPAVGRNPARASASPCARTPKGRTRSFDASPPSFTIIVKRLRVWRANSERLLNGSAKRPSAALGRSTGSRESDVERGADSALDPQPFENGFADAPQTW